MEKADLLKSPVLLKFFSNKIAISNLFFIFVTDRCCIAVRLTLKQKVGEL
jgi:hypothetical protein